MTGIFKRREKFGHRAMVRQTSRMPFDDTARDWRDVAASQGSLKIPGNHPT
jgi:hypothetical protein